MDLYMPTRLFGSVGCVAKHGNELAKLGKRCTIVSSVNAARESGALDDALKVLESHGVTCDIWDGVTANPTVSSCIKAGRFAHRHKAQFILGIGGGSALDAAKAASVFASNPQLNEDGFYKKAWGQAPLPIALIGTTAGTGSEVTKVAVLTDSAHRKHSIHDEALYATMAFGDSSYTRTCTDATTLTCGVDVVSHATESYFSNKATELSRACSVRALRLAMTPLASLIGGGKLGDDERRDLYEASILAGLAIDTTGTCFPHNVGYFLTEARGVPHGFASAVFLPDLLRCVRESDEAYVTSFFDEIGISQGGACAVIEACASSVKVHMSAKEIEAALPRWENNGSVRNTRAEVTSGTIRKILTDRFC